MSSVGRAGYEISTRGVPVVVDVASSQAVQVGDCPRRVYRNVCDIHKHKAPLVAAGDKHVTSCGRKRQVPDGVAGHYGPNDGPSRSRTDDYACGVRVDIPLI